MKMLTGFILGLSVLLLLGADGLNTITSMKLSGHLWTCSEGFHATFSGMSPEGDCFLAITNTMTGKTEIFKVTKKSGQSCDDTAYEKGLGRLVTQPITQRTVPLPPRGW
jgi:hypothetical protein